MLRRIALVFSASLLLSPLGLIRPSAAEDCPIKDLSFEAREKQLHDAPTCDRARELFGLCSYGANGDVPLGEIVTKRCEGDFLAKQNPAQRKTYNRAIKRCDDEYKNEDGSMYRAMAAGCRVDVAQSYARKLRKALRK